jgi:hypothetical protein
MNSTPFASTNTKSNETIKNSKEKETGFFKRLFKHDKDKDVDEEPKKAAGTP